MSSQHRGTVAVIIAAGLVVVMITVAGAVVMGIHVSEIGRDASWAVLGALGGALVAYLTSGKSK
jgi:hypothetical protein